VLNLAFFVLYDSRNKAQFLLIYKASGTTEFLGVMQVKENWNFDIDGKIQPLLIFSFLAQRYYIS
jgi:hypothetical protein